MTVSAKEVQELRKISGAGMMECKIALSEAAGNIDQAFKLLREKGIAKAEKKSSREAKEGLVGIKIDNNIATIIELNSETDFVSRNSEFPGIG
jgi:elongation factor Ts